MIGMCVLVSASCLLEWYNACFGFMKSCWFLVFLETEFKAKGLSACTQALFFSLFSDLYNPATLDIYVAKWFTKIFMLTQLFIWHSYLIWFVRNEVALERRILFNFILLRWLASTLSVPQNERHKYKHNNFLNEKVLKYPGQKDLQNVLKYSLKWLSRKWHM